MARARWLKPEFFTDAKVCAVADQPALVFAAVWLEADDGGVAPGDPRDLFGRRFIKRSQHGWTIETVEDGLNDLAQVGLVVPFRHRSEPFLLIPDFARKQGIQPKKWRHLGADHEAVVEAVLSRWNAGGAEENGALLAAKPSSSAIHPLAVAVASSQSHKPEPQPQPWRSAAGRDAWNDVIRQVPEAYRDALTGVLRASHDPDATACAIRALGPGGIHEMCSWEILGRAVLELRAGRGEFTPRRLQIFCRTLLEQPPEQQGLSEGDRARLEADELERRERARGAAT